MEETDYLNCLEEIVRDQVVSFTAKGKTLQHLSYLFGKETAYQQATAKHSVR